MLNQFLNFKGLYGEQNSSFSEMFIHFEPLKKRSELYHFEITEHLHADLIQIFFIKKGGGLLLTQGKKTALNTPCILIIPNNTLHGFVFQSDIKGQVITMPISYFENSLEDEKKVLIELNQLQQLTFEDASPLLLETENLLNNMIDEQRNNHAVKERALQLYFQLFLLQLYRAIKDAPTKIIPTENRMLAYFHTFQKLIKQSIHESKTIQQYAQEMNITPVHLNRICQTLVQKSALQVVHEYLLKDAKKYLLGTDNSITEISYFLDFTDPSHFSKFFKKMEGVSPRAFRKSAMV